MDEALCKLQHRQTLMLWLWEVTAEFRLHPSTFMMAATLFGRYWRTSPSLVWPKKLQVTGAACLLLASKFNEKYHPEVMDLVYIGDESFVRKDLVATERAVCEALDYRMSADTPMHHVAAPSDDATVRGWCCLYVAAGGTPPGHAAAAMAKVGPGGRDVRMAVRELTAAGDLQGDVKLLTAGLGSAYVIPA